MGIAINVFPFFVLGTGVNDWWDNGDKQIAFCRGGMGFIAFNDQLDTDLKVTLQVIKTNNSNMDLHFVSNITIY
jgi:alpha-amylase